MANLDLVEKDELFYELMTHKEIVFQICLGYSKNPLDAEDLTHEVYLKAFRKIEHLKDPSQKKDWLFRIAKNTCVDHSRKKRLRRFLPFTHGMAPLDPRTPEKRFVHDESLKALKNAVSKLPAKLKDTFILREYGQLSYHDIAGILGIKKGTVMSRLHRGRKLLREKLTSFGKRQ